MFRIPCFAVLLSVSAAIADEPLKWPGLLGPNRDGAATAALPDKLPGELATGWQIDVGTGYGTPLVDDGLIYQHARQGEDEVLICVERATGKELWKSVRPTPFKVGGGGEWHGKGPKACALLAEDCVITLSMSGELIARSKASGDVLWATEYGKEFQPNHPYWGASTSPIAADGKVFCHFGNDEVGTLACIDLKTGKELWRSGQDGTSYSSPLIAEFSGVRQLVEWNHNVLRGVDLANGNTLWSVPFAHESHNQNMPTPTVYDGRILLGAENRGLHCYLPEMADGKWTVENSWNNNDIALDMSSAVATNGHLYGMSHYSKGRLFCVDVATGEIMWQGDGRIGSNVAFLTAGHRVIALTDHGRLLVFAASPDEFEVIADWKISQQPTWAPPVLLPEGMLIKAQTTLSLLTF